jgi:hypothetical protein
MLATRAFPDELPELLNTASPSRHRLVCGLQVLHGILTNGSKINSYSIFEDTSRVRIEVNKLKKQATSPNKLSDTTILIEFEFRRPYHAPRAYHLNLSLVH